MGKKVLVIDDNPDARLFSSSVVEECGHSALEATNGEEGLEMVKAIPLNKFIPNFVSKKVHQNKPLFIFDQVGKQVRWLEYYLVENGYTEYYFLAGGATSVLTTQKYKN